MMTNSQNYQPLLCKSEIHFLTGMWFDTIQFYKQNCDQLVTTHFVSISTPILKLPLVRNISFACIQ